MAKQTNFNPAPGYIFLEPEEEEKKTASGIVLPDTASGEKPQMGKVIAVGDPEQTDSGEKKAPAKVGEMVVYKKWGGNEIKVEGKRP
ncbi:co-chaperone GroES, partial [Candidatus Woesebacteria bacterium]|nr:co-chaperone GroES [Candidatus Woesebacteria bacterium]